MILHWAKVGRDWSGYGIRGLLNWGAKGLGMWKGRKCRCLANWQIHNQPHAVKFHYTYCLFVFSVKWSSWFRKRLGKDRKIAREVCQLLMPVFVLFFCGKFFSPAPHLTLFVLTDWLLNVIKMFHLVNNSTLSCQSLWVHLHRSW